MLATHDLLDQLEKADEILEKICKLHGKGESTKEEDKYFNYIHGTISRTTYELEHLISMYEQITAWREYETDYNKN